MSDSKLNSLSKRLYQIGLLDLEVSWVDKELGIVRIYNRKQHDEVICYYAVAVESAGAIGADQYRGQGFWKDLWGAIKNVFKIGSMSE